MKCMSKLETGSLMLRVFPKPSSRRAQDRLMLNRRGCRTITCHAAVTVIVRSVVPCRPAAAAAGSRSVGNLPYHTLFALPLSGGGLPIKANPQTLNKPPLVSASFPDKLSTLPPPLQSCRLLS